jgi:hypothetical protein
MRLKWNLLLITVCVTIYGELLTQVMLLAPGQFLAGESRMRTDFVVPMVFGGALTKYFVPTTDDNKKNRFEIRFLLCWNFKEPP